jgi:beta-lactamase superfamily II metal-dependent hydrolase
LLTSAEQLRKSTLNEWLEIHVFGAYAVGEGIVVKFPDGKYAVIDCCAKGSESDGSDNPIIAFLDERRVKSLAFACLTHPHIDHFRGLKQVIAFAPPQVFYRSGAMFPHVLQQVAKAEYSAAKQSNTDSRQTSLQMLVELDNYLKLMKIRCERAGLNTQLYPFKVSNSKSFSVKALAPSGGEVDSYHGSLVNCFKADGTPKPNIPDLPHNSISIGFYIECQKFNIVLGGDVTTANWQNVLTNHIVDFAKPATRLVKVSHHGSKTGDCPGLWESFASGKETLAAVVTGFQTALPEWDTLARIANFADSIFCTHRKSLERSKDVRFASVFAPDPLSLILSQTGFANISKSSGSPSVGRCSFGFSRDGAMKADVLAPAVSVSRDAIRRRKL